jgi:hypothetical protein
MENENKRKYPPGTKIETDERGRRIVTLPNPGRGRLSIDSKGIHGTELTKGENYTRKP